MVKETKKYDQRMISVTTPVKDEIEELKIIPRETTSNVIDRIIQLNKKVREKYPEVYKELS